MISSIGIVIASISVAMVLLEVVVAVGAADAVAVVVVLVDVVVAAGLALVPNPYRSCRTLTSTPFNLTNPRYPPSYIHPSILPPMCLYMHHRYERKHKFKHKRTDTYICVTKILLEYGHFLRSDTQLFSDNLYADAKYTQPVYRRTQVGRNGAGKTTLMSTIAARGVSGRPGTVGLRV